MVYLDVPEEGLKTYTVDTVSGNTVTFTDPLEVDVFEGAPLYRTLTGKLDMKLSSRLRTNEVAEVRYRIEGIPGVNKEYRYPTSAPMFKGRPVLEIPFNWGRSVTVAWESHRQEVDMKFGRISFYDRAKFSSYVLAATWDRLRRTDVDELWSFFGHVRGRAGSFWLPAPTVDMQLFKDAVAGADSLTFHGKDLFEQFQHTDTHRAIRVELKDGTVAYHEVTAISTHYEGGEDVTVFTFTPALTTDVTLDNVRDIRWLFRVRSMSDGLTITWRSDEVATATWRMVMLAWTDPLP